MATIWKVCNCDVLTKSCLGENMDLDSHTRKAPPFTRSRMLARLLLGSCRSGHKQATKPKKPARTARAMETDRSSQALAALFGCTPATFADEELLAALVTRGCLFTGTLFRTKRRRAWEKSWRCLEIRCQWRRSGWMLKEWGGFKHPLSTTRIGRP